VGLGPCHSISMIAYSFRSCHEFHPQVSTLCCEHAKDNLLSDSIISIANQSCCWSQPFLLTPVKRLGRVTVSFLASGKNQALLTDCNGDTFKQSTWSMY
jgi:hypothetical protein